MLYMRSVSLFLIVTCLKRTPNRLVKGHFQKSHQLRHPETDDHSLLTHAQEGTESACQAREKRGF